MDRQKRVRVSGDSVSLPDPYAIAEATKDVRQGKTVVGFNTYTRTHKCEWDSNYPERPERQSSIINKLHSENLFTRCDVHVNKCPSDIRERVQYVHPPEQIRKLIRICEEPLPMEIFEHESEKYDSIFLNAFSFDAALGAVASTVCLVDDVATGRYQNGFAVVRPPGHHAKSKEFAGYCFFNNVAVAAESIIRDRLVKKVLIFDIDVHHGNGTQDFFYNRDDVLYISIHRYENGKFWPNTTQADFFNIGSGPGLGYNINIPLNTTKLSDSDYLAIMFNLVLPIGYEFNPDLVIISLGFDAAIGCPEGEMNLTPGFYSHMISQIKALAKGKVAVVLEGGYFLPSMAESANLTVKALLGAKCPVLDATHEPHHLVIESISKLKRMLKGKWKCLDITEIGEPDSSYEIVYYGRPASAPYETRDAYPTNTGRENFYNAAWIELLTLKYDKSIDNLVYYVSDQRMLGHDTPDNQPSTFERPERLSSIMKTFEEFNLHKRMFRCSSVVRNYNRYNPHEQDFVTDYEIPAGTKDLYKNDFTKTAVDVAVCGVLALCDSVMNRLCRSGIAFVRPPGHHAEIDKPRGFCYVNNIAIAAHYLNEVHSVKKILIIDFDIHHGNGTQNIFYVTDTVLYISIHRFEDGKFFPNTPYGSIYHDGHGPGKGFNINIPFSNGKMGNTEYMTAFHNIILPIAYSYAPEVILVSAGFDAGINDPLGGYTVSPELFGHFIHCLRPLANGKMIVVLEGGYNLATTAYGACICAKALLGDPVLMPEGMYSAIKPSALVTIREVINHFKKFWPVLNIHQKLKNNFELIKTIRGFTEDDYESEWKIGLDEAQMNQNANYVKQQIYSLNDYFL